jgi:hypothetical protein
MAAARTDLRRGAAPARGGNVVQASPRAHREATFDMASVAVTLVWHARTDADAQYFRELIAKAVRDPPKHGRRKATGR